MNISLILFFINTIFLAYYMCIGYRDDDIIIFHKSFKFMGMMGFSVFNYVINKHFQSIGIYSTIVCLLFTTIFIYISLKKKAN